jgi:hypothetical protein
MEGVINDHEEMDLAEEIIDGRKCQNTKNQYGRKFEHFRKWKVTKYPECALTDGVTVNLAIINKDHMHDFFGHICKKKNGGNYINPVIYQTFQHVSGYKSTVKDHFSSSDCKIIPDIEIMLKSFLGVIIEKSLV